MLGDSLRYIKECWDLITEPFIYMKHSKSLDYPKYRDKTFNNTLVDLENNRIGGNFVKQNPKATDKEIMQYGFLQAMQNRNRQYERKPLSRFQQKMTENVRSMKKTEETQHVSNI